MSKQGKQIPKWYDDKIEEPMQELVFKLRNNGFNTIWSCGHLPRPYVTMIPYRNKEDELLNNFLVRNGYRGYEIKYDKHGQKNKYLDVVFSNIDGKDGELINKDDLIGGNLPDDILDLLDNDSYNKYQPVIGYSGSSQHKINQYNRILDSIEQFGLMGKKVLEPGPLFGYYSFGMTRRGAKVTAIERDPKKIEICNKLKDWYDLDVNFIESDFMKYDFENDSYDMIVLINIFHHCLFRNRWLSFSILDRLSRRIPEMIFCMGETLGPKNSGMTQDMIGKYILDNTSYNYCKKIEVWGTRNVYYFCDIKGL